MLFKQRGLVNGCVDRGRVQTARFAVAILSCGVCLWWTSVAPAATFVGLSVDGHPVSATADFTAVGDNVTVKLTNTTATTLDAGELFTGLEFTISGLTPTMTSDTGIQRTVANDGTFVDTGLPQNLSWSLVSPSSGTWQLNFNPNAEDSIIGPPTAGSYSGANGSIKGNAGHNPFAAEMAVFELNVPGLSLIPLPSVDVTAFLFGTGLDPGVGRIVPGGGLETVPEPAAAVLLMGAGLALAAGCWRRRS